MATLFVTLLPVRVNLARHRCEKVCFSKKKKNLMFIFVYFLFFIFFCETGVKSKHSSIVAELVMQYMGDFPAMDGRDAGIVILFF